VAAALGEHRAGGAHIAHEAPQERLVIGDDDLKVGTMPSFGGVLTSAQIRDVVEYTRVQLGK